MSQQIALKVQPLYTEIIGLPKSALFHIKKALSADTPNKEWNPAVRKHYWDGKIRFYSQRKTGFFVPTGFLWMIEEYLQQEHLPYIKNNPYMPANNLFSQDLDLDIIKLKGIDKFWEGQEVALQAMLSLGRCIIMAPTGSGKTELMLGFSQYFLLTQPEYTAVLFITHRRSIYEDVFAERLKERMDIQHPFFDMDGIKAFAWKNRVIAITMSQTLIANIVKNNPNIQWLIQNTRALFSDEVHATETQKRKSTIKKDKVSRKINIYSRFPNAYCRFGLSATPFKQTTEGVDRLHMLSTMQYFGVVVPIEHTHVVKPVVHIYPIDYPDRLPTKKELQQQRLRHQAERGPYYDYPTAKQSLQYNLQRMGILKQLSEEYKKQGKKIIVFIQEIEHGKKLSNFLHAPFLWGNTKTKDRQETCRKFEDGIHQLLIVNSIFYFGVNLKTVDTIFLYHIGKSYIDVWQAIGRGMRDNPGKKVLNIIDFHDKDSAYLEDHYSQRFHFYKESTAEVIYHD